MIEFIKCVFAGVAGLAIICGFTALAVRYPVVWGAPILLLYTAVFGKLVLEAWRARR